MQKMSIYKPCARNYYGFNFIVWKISVKITTAGVVIYVDDAPTVVVIAQHNTRCSKELCGIRRPNIRLGLCHNILYSYYNA